MLGGGFRFGQGSSVAAPARVTLNGQTASGVTWTNMPAALTVFLGITSPLTEQWVDLRLARQARLSVSVRTAGFAGSELLVRYQTASGGAYAELAATVGEGDRLIDTVNSVVLTPWFDIAAGANADVILSLWGQGGDAILDPGFGIIAMEFRT